MKWFAILVLFGSLFLCNNACAQTWHNPSDLDEFNPTANIGVNIGSLGAETAGQTATFKVKAGHIFNNDDATTTIYQSVNTVVSSEQQADTTILAPPGGWPQSTTEDTELHISIKVPKSGGGYVIRNLNILIIQVVP